jgi:hypothetical protein
MQKMLSRVLAVAFLATLTLANSAGAATILVFGQSNAADDITERVVGATTQLISGSGTTATAIPVSITNLGGITPPGGAIAAFETFTLTSPSVAGAGATSLDNFSGTIQFSQTPGGVSILTATITNGLLTLTGTSGTFSTGTSVFTNLNGAIIAQLGGATTATGGSALAFSNVSGTIASGFTAQNSGDFAANPIPEPASLISGSFAVLAGLGLFGLRRFKASKA